MKAHDKAPVFSEGTHASVNADENGDYKITFTRAEFPEGYIVHKYKILIDDKNGKEILKDNIIVDYYIIDDFDTQGFTVSKDLLEAGITYTLTVTAESAYHFYSKPIILTFTA